MVSIPRACSLILAVVLWAPVVAPAAGTPEGLPEMRAFAKRLLQTERYDEALNTYITIALQTPDDPRSHYDVAGVMAFLRMYAEALKPLDKAIALDPDNTLYLELAALCNLQIQRWPEAFEMTRRGAELGDMKAMYTLAGMYEHGRGTEASDAQALAWLERAARAGHMSAMDAMARVYRDGLYGQTPDPAREQEWRRTLERALAQ